MGLNYYVTSERWLDESLEKYPSIKHMVAMAGTDMQIQKWFVPILLPGVDSKYWRLRSGSVIIFQWPLPSVISIVQGKNNCDGLRKYGMNATDLTRQGINIKGVTAWALLGSFDWDTLLTKTGTQYESGVFDIKTFNGTTAANSIVQLY